MKKLLLIPVLAVIFSVGVTLAAEKSKHNPQGDDDVEKGYQEHQKEHKEKQERERKEKKDKDSDDNYEVKKSHDEYKSH